MSKSADGHAEGKLPDHRRWTAHTPVAARRAGLPGGRADVMIRLASSNPSLPAEVLADELLEQVVVGRVVGRQAALSRRVDRWYAHASISR
jgi:hypothetical protein